jgi:hypothetical protein
MASALALFIKSQFGIWRSRQIVRAEPPWEQPACSSIFTIHNTMQN